MLARPIAKEMHERLGQPVVLEYKPGAGGSIATGYLARSKPDGYTVLMVLAAHAINPFLYDSLPYNTQTDFSPVSLVATLPLIVAAPNETPADTIEELIAYAKAHPDELTFASAGNGNTSHLAAELFKLETDTKMLHIPYKGSGPAVVALLSGEVSLMFDSISTSMPHIKAGKLKALAVSSATRAPLMPDVPTILESGTDVVVNGWYGIIAPANTPAEVVDTLSAAFAEAAKKPATTELLEGFGYQVIGSTPSEFDQHLNEEFERWGSTIKQAGIKLQ